eukprot:8936371-Lingulodinium_polyedra.AAC.1
MNARRDAFLALTGIGASTLQVARGGLWRGKVSWSSPARRGTHAGEIESNSKTKTYLGTRQWLE